MKLSDIIRINLKKLKYRTGKAMYLVLPITVLVSLSVIITSQVANFREATNQSIFGAIKEENTVLQLTKQEETTSASTQGFKGFQAPTQFNENDLSKISDIPNVTSASLNYTLPISNAKTTDLFTDKTVNLNNLVALDASMASLYTTEDFNYTDGQVIPIILNANSFMYTYEDWGGKTEIAIEMRAPGTRTGKPGDLKLNTPIKTAAIEYNKDELIGKEFTVTFGGFDALNTFQITRENNSMKFVKLTSSELKTNENNRKTAINKYWDYSKLSKGVTYTFKVVGVIESETSRQNYIPQAFANKVMTDYINLEHTSRKSTPATSLLGTTYTGLQYDGSELSNGSNSFGFAVGGFGGPKAGAVMRFEGSSSNNSQSYTIPGLVLEMASDDSGDVKGIYKDATVFTNSVKTSQTISVKINSVENRSQVISDINTAGFALVDVNNLTVFENIQKTLNNITSWVTVAFIVLTVAVIMLTMSKFVSESNKEIGIFRAIGFTKRNILSIFLAQGLIYTAVGYLVGLGIGLLGNILSSTFVANWFNSFLNNTIKAAYTTASTVEVSVFRNFDFQSITVLSVILLIITIVIAFIPAYSASNVSPVEAIKSE